MRFTPSVVKVSFQKKKKSKLGEFKQKIEQKKKPQNRNTQLQTIMLIIILSF